MIAPDGRGAFTDGHSTYSLHLQPDGLFLSPNDGLTLHRATVENGHPALVVSGTGPLRRFRFRITHSKTKAGQTAAGTFTYDASLEEAISALTAAGLKLYRGAHPGLMEFRSRGSFFTGARSAHFLLHQIPLHPGAHQPHMPQQTQGEFHFGEHNPYSPLGWLFHWLLEAGR